MGATAAAAARSGLGAGVSRSGGATLLSVTVALSLTAPLTPSSTVSVTVKVPSSVQLIVVTGAPASSKVQVAPASTSEPTVYDHRVLGAPPSSRAEPFKPTGLPSLPRRSGPALTRNAFAANTMHGRLLTADRVPRRCPGVGRR